MISMTNEGTILEKLIEEIRKSAESCCFLIHKQHRNVLSKKVNMDEFVKLDQHEQKLILDEAGKIDKLNSWGSSENSPIGVSSDSEINLELEDNTDTLKKCVRFEFPHISSMKQLPRLTEMERKELFYEDKELDDLKMERDSESF
jgi:hypothetical protein